MNRHLSILLSQPASMMFAVCLGLASASAMAAGTPASAGTSSPEAQYRQDMALCKSGQSNEDKATCEREAGAALQAARRGKLTSEQPAAYQQDATKRCASLPADQREGCMALMSDSSNTQVQGSVAGGGILRTTTIPVPANTAPAGMPPMPASPAPGGGM